MRNFNLNEEIEIKNYLNNILYTGYYKVFNGIKTSLFDQKVCFDLLQADCKCILNFCENRHIDHFTMLDLFNDEFTQNLFRNKTFHNGKAVINSNTIREYNKVFLQIFESLSYTEILSKSRLGRTNVYTIRELAILRLLANSADACITFICLSAYKFIESSNLLNSWNTYINSPNRMNLHTFRDNYDSYMMTHTKHQADTHQIFQKIVNPLFYLYELTKYAPTKNSKFLLQSPNDLSYFRVHRRDQNIRQLGETRIQIAQRIRQNMMATDNILLNEEKQKNLVGKWNYQYYKDDYNLTETQRVSEYSTPRVLYNGYSIHHIWPKNAFLGDDSYFFDPNSCENMILVDEGDHRHRLHLNGNTREINRTTLPVALFKQLEKIINFNNARVGEYKLETLYRLLCFINNVTIQSIPSRQILIGYIEELISTIH